MKKIKKILFTETEIEDQLENLGFEIEDLEATKKVDPSKEMRLPLGTLNRMLTTRQEEVESLKEQALFFDDDDGAKLDMKELTFSTLGRHNLFFITHRFKSGHFLGFWSHSPCSTTQNQERGWVVISPDNLKVVDKCTTAGLGKVGRIKPWRKNLRHKFGKATILHDGIDTNKPVWRMNEC